VKELLWNIFDNAFKHGTKDLVVRTNRAKQGKVTLEIIDTAGGLSADIQEFLNDPDSLNSPSAPGIGLGIILIRGLSLLCEIPMTVRNVVNSEGASGTLFLMKFEYED
jgi:K+-sensing histidine kinase KdpD